MRFWPPRKLQRNNSARSSGTTRPCCIRNTETLDVGRAIGVTPDLTAAVDTLLVKGARELALLVPLSGEQFGESYVAAMIKSHQEVLRKIDHQFLEEAD